MWKLWFFIDRLWWYGWEWPHVGRLFGKDEGVWLFWSRCDSGEWALQFQPLAHCLWLCFCLTFRSERLQLSTTPPVPAGYHDAHKHPLKLSSSTKLNAFFYKLPWSWCFVIGMEQLLRHYLNFSLWWEWLKTNKQKHSSSKMWFLCHSWWSPLKTSPSPLH